MHNYISEKDNIAICIIYIIRVKEYYWNIKTYQKYGVPSQELKLLFCVELQKEEN